MKEKIVGVKAVAGLTKGLNGYNGYVQCMYNITTGHVFGTLYFNQNTYGIYKDENIIYVADIKRPCKMVEIKEMVCEACFRIGL